MSIKIIVLVDDIWRLAKSTEAPDRNNGSVQAELNGRIIILKKGWWFNINDDYKEETIREMVIEKNISLIMERAMIRKMDREDQERQRKREQRDAERAVAQNNQPPAPEANLPVLPLP